MTAGVTEDRVHEDDGRTQTNSLGLSRAITRAEMPRGVAVASIARLPSSTDDPRASGSTADRHMEHAYTYAAAALIDQVDRALSAVEGEPARVAVESSLAHTLRRLGCRSDNPLGWKPSWDWERELGVRQRASPPERCSPVSTVIISTTAAAHAD